MPNKKFRVINGKKSFSIEEMVVKHGEIIVQAKFSPYTINKVYRYKNILYLIKFINSEIQSMEVLGDEFTEN